MNRDNSETWKKYFEICLQLDEGVSYSQNKLIELIGSVFNISTKVIIKDHLMYMYHHHFINIDFGSCSVNVNLKEYYEEFKKKVG